MFKLVVKINENENKVIEYGYCFILRFVCRDYMERFLDDQESFILVFIRERFVSSVIFFIYGDLKRNYLKFYIEGEGVFSVRIEFEEFDVLGVFLTVVIFSFNVKRKQFVLSFFFVIVNGVYESEEFIFKKLKINGDSFYYQLQESYLERAELLNCVFFFVSFSVVFSFSDFLFFYSVVFYRLNDSIFLFKYLLLEFVVL